MSQKITPFLWFDTQAEEAATFYASIFKQSKITKTTHYLEATEDVSGKPKGSVMSVEFELNGQSFMALNGGPHYTFSPATSFVIDCADQAEVDHFWEKLSAGGEELQCGWLTDKYGVTWQVVPVALTELLSASTPEKCERVTKAMLGMVKLDIAKLEQA